MNLSKRLEAVASLVSTGHTLADVGTDHGYVPIYLIETDRIPHAVAMDINRGPLEKAKENILAHHLEHAIETRLSDGLAKLLPGEADTVLIAGMGGSLMSRIIADGKDVLESVSELVLQPQSEIGAFRHFLHETGYKIADEQMLIDDGKYYVMFKAVKGFERYASEAEYTYGSILLHQKHPVLYEYIEKKLESYKNILKHLAKTDSVSANRRCQVLLEKSAIGKEALKYYDMP